MSKRALTATEKHGLNQLFEHLLDNSGMRIDWLPDFEFGAQVDQADADLELVTADGNNSFTVSLDMMTTLVTTDAMGDDIATELADGTYAGQRKTIVLLALGTAGDIAWVPVTNAGFANAIKLPAVNDSATLEWSVAEGKWYVVSLTGTATLAALPG